MELKHVNIKMRNLWFITRLIFFIIIAVAYVILITIDNAICQTIVLWVGGTIVLLNVFFLLIYPFLKYKFYKYGYNEKRIEIKYGVIFRHHIVIPVCQIQDLHTYQGPLLQLTNLCGIIFSTAGSNFSLQGLETSDATQIVNDIEAYLNNKKEETINEEVH